MILNLQQTPQDGFASLRFFGRSDDILARVAKLLAVSVPKAPPAWSEDRVFVPYDERGKRTDGRKMVLDLRSGQQVMITDGHNLKGAGQPKHQQISTSPQGRVLRRSPDVSAFILDIEGVEMKLGLWWLDVAKRGAVAQLPVVNVAPRFEAAKEAKSGPARPSSARAPLA